MVTEIRTVIVTRAVIVTVKVMVLIRVIVMVMVEVTSNGNSHNDVNYINNDSGSDVV